MSIKLLRPKPEHRAAVMDFRAELLAAGEPFDGCAGLEETQDYTLWLDFEGRMKRKYAEGAVPSEVFLAMNEDGLLVGMMDFRHPLTEFLLRYGGNIGYSVRPSQKRRGYGKAMLAALLPICGKMGEKRVLLTCDGDNEASRRTILANGGVLENRVADLPGLGQSGVIERYWIQIRENC